jgi:hypothetical protein
MCCATPRRPPAGVGPGAPLSPADSIRGDERGDERADDGT